MVSNPHSGPCPFPGFSNPPSLRLEDKVSCSVTAAGEIGVRQQEGLSRCLDDAGARPMLQSYFAFTQSSDGLIWEPWTLLVFPLRSRPDLGERVLRKGRELR